MRKSIPTDPVRTPSCPVTTQLHRQARHPSLAERVAALDRLTAWPTLRLRCALRQPA
ncbi:hypothetical protein [Roseateles puraquae]|jgi:hypothetical protein|uniref:hypothetical protein n=1 Tax=Roseateles puraquae TaxID=431059 RepID=UPI001303247B|nr:hypothetical protein [Roseateles puraquae]